MFVVEFVFALVISMLCAAMLLPVTARSGWRVRHPRVEPISVFAMLFVLFLATWAGGIWLVPLGPKLWGVAWGSFVAVALFVALLLGALGPDEPVPSSSGGRIRPRVLDLLLLLLLLLLILAIVAGYAWHR